MDFFALLIIEFEDSADRISREMFIERLGQMDWQRDTRLPCAWTLMFEERSSRDSALRTINNHLDLACQRGRITRKDLRALVHFGPEPPIQV